MFWFLDPPPTPYDLHFRLLGIPVRIHPMFWLVVVLLGDLRGSPQQLLLWIIAVLISILVHEFGHALTMRRFGQSPRIVLYALGGYATARGNDYTWGGWSVGVSRLSTAQQILVLLAGPGAGFILAVFIFALVKLTRGTVVFLPELPWFWRVELGIGARDDYPLLYELVYQLLYVNIWWGVINLLPVYPLDGGQLVREVCIWRDPWRGIRWSLLVSVITGAAVAVFAFAHRELFLAILFGMLAWQSYVMLHNATGR